MFVNGILSAVMVSICCLGASCAWSVTSLRTGVPQNGRRLDSTLQVDAVPSDASIICSRLPIKIIGVDGHHTYKAYRSTNKALFIVEPGLHTVEYRFGDDMNYMSEILVAQVEVETGTSAEIILEKSLPIQAAQHPLEYNSLWIANFITGDMACR